MKLLLSQKRLEQAQSGSNAVIFRIFEFGLFLVFKKSDWVDDRRKSSY